MGLLDKILKRRPKADEVSPGGSQIYHYEEQENQGFRPPQEYGKYADTVIKHFEEQFPGRESFVFHELISDLVHIDVNIMKPTEEDDFYVMYTTGMSDLPMTLPEEIADREDLKYGELFMFLPDTWNPGGPGADTTSMTEEEYWPIRIIKFLARFPHEYNTWLGSGHTIPNGAEYEPLAENTKLGGVVLTQSGGDIGTATAEDGTEINIFMVVPAYQEEIEYKLKYGMEALDKKFIEGALPVVLDIHRPNFCADFKERLD